MDEIKVINKFWNDIIDNISLQRNSSYESKRTKLSNTILKKIEKARQIKSSFKNYIVIFFQTLTDKNANFDFSNFMKNIKHLNIVVLSAEQMDCGGEFVLCNNTIYINEKELSKIEDIIFHELFHMAVLIVLKKQLVAFKIICCMKV